MDVIGSSSSCFVPQEKAPIPIEHKASWASELVSVWQFKGKLMKLFGTELQLLSY
jgi:hypothetical protein